MSVCVFNNFLLLALCFYGDDVDGASFDWFNLRFVFVLFSFLTSSDFALLLSLLLLPGLSPASDQRVGLSRQLAIIFLWLLYNNSPIR